MHVLHTLSCILHAFVASAAALQHTLSFSREGHIFTSPTGLQEGQTGCQESASYD
jgi:hypothetical protein